MPAADALLLALDAGSPVVSVALGRSGRVLGQRSTGIERSSEELLAMIDAVLAVAAARPCDLGGVIALRGPGSFTGLRVGLATALGLHDALGIAAAAAPTLRVIATSAPRAPGVIAAAVNAMRGEWFVERFADGEPPPSLGSPEIVAASELSRLAADRLVGFGISRLPRDGGPPALEPPPLAAAALELAWREGLDWDAGQLVEPLYLREPATTPAKR